MLLQNRALPKVSNMTAEIQGDHFKSFETPIHNIRQRMAIVAFFPHSDRVSVAAEDIQFPVSSIIRICIQ